MTVSCAPIMSDDGYGLCGTDMGGMLSRHLQCTAHNHHHRVIQARTLWQRGGDTNGVWSRMIVTVTIIVTDISLWHRTSAGMRGQDVHVTHVRRILLSVRCRLMADIISINHGKRCAEYRVIFYIFVLTIKFTDCIDWWIIDLCLCNVLLLYWFHRNLATGEWITIRCAMQRKLNVKLSRWGFDCEAIEMSWPGQMSPGDGADIRWCFVPSGGLFV